VDLCWVDIVRSSFGDVVLLLCFALLDVSLTFFDIVFSARLCSQRASRIPFLFGHVFAHISERG